MSKRVSNILVNLPRNITPVNLEELRRVKSALVELESKADNLRCARACMHMRRPLRRPKWLCVLLACKGCIAHALLYSCPAG